jgi:hypothetical protein
MLPSHIYLDNHNIPYTGATFPLSTPKGAARVATVFGLPEHQTVDGFRSFLDFILMYGVTIAV